MAQIIEMFNIDWEHSDAKLSTCEGLHWTNDNSRRHMADSSTRLDIGSMFSTPKYVDAVILDHIAAAADRGVKVRARCGGRHGISDWDIRDTFASLRTSRRFGIKVQAEELEGSREAAHLDDQHALLGSMNIDRSALDLRRDLRITISDPGVVARLREVFDTAGNLSLHDDPPDPLDESRGGFDSGHLAGDE